MHTTRIVAVRHGETDWNASARIQGQRDIPLNDKGRWQAERAAQALLAAGEPLGAIYSSDLSRAHATAQAIASAHGMAVRGDVRLRERNFGEYEGHSFDELERLWPQDAARWRARDATWAPPGGETLITLGERIRAVTDALAQRHPGEQIVLVAHGGVLDMMYRIATRQGVDAQRNWALGNASINRLLWTPGGLSLVGWSDTRHLDQDWRDETIT
ncbi:MAG TPA: histidine phosphatase family protein [Burkholderiaceae bacterium]|mgnify:CR=1 FL=1|nr:histidine phosphatase family protein [Burkholderiaceae bacterium]